jgi:cytochrome P450
LSILARAPDETGAAAAEGTIAAHLLTMFGASYETSQSGLAWALFLLAQHPAAAARVLEELPTPADDAAAATDQIARCEWLDAVVKESLRMMPPVPILFRRASCDTNFVGYDIPRGVYVALSPLLTNRDPILYPDPDKFKPERWASIKPGQYEYVVFSAGPRFCIGAWFATMFLKVAISRILRRYRVAVTPGARIDQAVGVTMNAKKSGIAVTIYPQDGRFEASPVRGNIVQLVEMTPAESATPA